MKVSKAFMCCPHCDEPAIVRTSVRLSKLVRESTLQCRNALCGHTFTAYTEIARTISPSACPRGDICLPMTSASENVALKAKLADAAAATGKAD